MLERMKRLVENRNELHTGVETALAISAIVGAGTAAYGAMNQPKIPKAPKQPKQIVGAEPEVKTTGTLEEDATAKTSARKTARKGATAYRIPLEAKSTGTKTTGGSGLNI